MLLIDDLLALPFKGFMGIFKKIQEIAEVELEDTAEKLKTELLKAQMLFETDQINEEEYFKKEEDILKRLEGLKKTE